MKLILNSCLVFLLCFSSLEAAKVSRVTGYADKSSGRSADNQDNKIIKTAEQIESALKIVQENDIRTYNTLLNIRISNFDKFLADLQQWIDDNDPSKSSREKKRLGELLRKLDFELGELAQSLSRETDEIKKVELQNQICSKVTERINAELEQERLFVRLKKMELGYEETRLLQKIRNREIREKALISRYMPEGSEDSVSDKSAEKTGE